jgi:hypothetical protein
MYDNNYQKFNFTIGFSRIFLAQNESIDDNLNENSVLYVTFNNRIYRQYVKHYTYKMSRGESLPEITVDMNEELNVTRTQIEQQAALQTRLATRTRGMWLQDIDSVEQRITRRTVGRNAEALVNGSIISRDSNSSVVEINDMSEKNDYDIYDTQYDVEVNHYKKDDFVVKNGTDLMIGSEIHLPTMYKDGRTLKKRTWNGTAFVNDSTPIVPVEVSGTSSAVNTISTSKEYEDIIGGVAQIDDALRCATVDNNGRLVYSLPNVSADPKEHPDRCVEDDAELWFREVPIQPDFPS